jgi:hypothetical protein
MRDPQMGGEEISNCFASFKNTNKMEVLLFHKDTETLESNL